MDSPIPNIASVLVPRLERLIDSTESIYLNLAELFPKIVREMNSSIEESGKRSEFLGKEGAEFGGLAEKASALVDSARAAINDSDGYLGTMRKNDFELLSVLESDIERLSGLDGIIGGIKDDSEEMELISLNAMTVALKSGAEGRAFSVITDELKRLSNRTIDLTDSLTDQGKRLLGLYSKYKADIEELEVFQTELFGKFEATLQSSFRGIVAAIGETSSALSALSRDSHKVRGPILEIMQEIQNQDIVRQSVNHVIISLQEIDKADTADYELSDTYIFIDSLCNLSRSLLSDVEIKLRKSFEVFRDNISAVEEVIRSVERERKSFIDGFTRNGGGSALESEFRAASAELPKYISRKNALSANGERLAYSVKDLDEKFKAFGQTLSRFHTIVIASKIEVSKRAILRTMTDTVGEMNVLTEKIEVDVAKAVDSTNVFIRSSGASITRYSAQCKSDEPRILKATQDIEKQFCGLWDVRRAMESEVRDFRLYTDEFVSLVGKSRGSLDSLAILPGEIEAIRAKLDEVSKDASRGIARLCKGIGSEAHSIKNERLKNVIQNFTIFAHKKTAGELGGFSVEEGVSAGDITLF